MQHGREPLALEFPEQQGDGAIEHRFEVAVRDDVTHQILDPTELGVRSGADGKLHLVAVERQRGHDVRTPA